MVALPSLSIRAVLKSSQYMMRFGTHHSSDITHCSCQPVRIDRDGVWIVIGRLVRELAQQFLVLCVFSVAVEREDQRCRCAAVVCFRYMVEKLPCYFVGSEVFNITTSTNSIWCFTLGGGFPTTRRRCYKRICQRSLWHSWLPDLPRDLSSPFGGAAVEYVMKALVKSKTVGKIEETILSKLGLRTK